MEGEGYEMRDGGAEGVGGVGGIGDGGSDTVHSSPDYTVL